MNDDVWTVRFSTPSRDAAITTSVLLISAVDEKRITNEKTKIFIVGGVGKSLIVDAMARHLSDRHTTHNMPTTRFVEGKPNSAVGRRGGRQIVRNIVHKGKGCVVTFCHLGGLHERSWLHQGLSKIFKSQNVGLDFMTEIDEGFNETFIPDIAIKFNPIPSKNNGNDWQREWVVSIENDDLKTPTMEKVLNRLRQCNLTPVSKSGFEFKVG